jgi:hypothetical protein
MEKGYVLYYFKYITSLFVEHALFFPKDIDALIAKYVFIIIKTYL